jgi:hypothetical protein
MRILRFPGPRCSPGPSWLQDQEASKRDTIINAFNHDLTLKSGSVRNKSIRIVNEKYEIAT